MIICFDIGNVADITLSREGDVFILRYSNGNSGVTTKEYKSSAVALEAYSRKRKALKIDTFQYPQATADEIDNFLHGAQHNE